MLYALLCYNAEDVVFSWSQAEDDAVMEAWAGLGYYSRARNLVRGARAVVAASPPRSATRSSRRLAQSSA